MNLGDTIQLIAENKVCQLLGLQELDLAKIMATYISKIYHVSNVSKSKTKELRKYKGE